MDRGLLAERRDAEAPPGLPSGATQHPNLSPKPHPQWRLRQAGPTVTMAMCSRLPFRTVFVGPAASQWDGGVLRWVRDSREFLRAQRETQPCSLKGHTPPHLSPQISLSSVAHEKLEDANKRGLSEQKGEQHPHHLVQCQCCIPWQTDTPSLLRVLFVTGTEVIH